MEIKMIHDSGTVLEFMKNRNRYNYIYQFNNVAQREWSNTICYGGYEEDVLKEVAFVYVGYNVPVLIGVSFEENNYNIELIKELKPYLPKKFYTHISRDVLDEVFKEDEITDYHDYVNMGISDYSKLDNFHKENTTVMGIEDMPRLEKLFSESYPDSWLDEKLLSYTDSFGVEVSGDIVSYAGIHAYSEETGVAAVAHVTTHPDYRGKGYGKDVVAALVRSMKDKISHIGLNVKIQNIAAIKCYERLGFERYGEFVACDIEIKG